MVLLISVTVLIHSLEDLLKNKRFFIINHYLGQYRHSVEQKVMDAAVSFMERINELAIRRKNDTFQFDIFQSCTIFNEDSIKNWSLKTESLFNDLKQLHDPNQIENWFRALFLEIFHIITHENWKTLSINLVNISELLNKLFTVCDEKMLKIVGKSYVSISSVLPQFNDNTSTNYLINETNLVKLTELLNPIHMEIFKFSWLSAKLSERKQTILLRHLLKKSKYEIHKFNLLHENATGFSQLSLLFVNYYEDSSTVNNPSRIDYFINEMYYIMGKYSLESMRSLDIFLLISSEYILTSYMKCINFLKRTDFINIDNGSTKNNLILSNIILFNLQENNDIHTNYQNLVSILIKFKLVDPIQIWENLSPNSTTLNDWLNKLEDILEKESMKGVDNPLAMAAALTNEEDEVNESIDDKSTNDKRDSNNKDSEDEVETNKNITENKDSQLEEIEAWKSSKKILFLKNLIIHGCFNEAFSIIVQYPKLIYLDSKIIQLLARCIEYSIHPLYKETSYCFDENQDALQQCSLITTLDNDLINTKPRLFKLTKTLDINHDIELNVQYVFYFSEWIKDLPIINSIDQLFKFSHEILSVLGPYLAHCPTLITKIVRIAINNIGNEINETAANTVTVEKWVNYFRKFIFPCVPLFDKDTCVATEVYNLMKLFPFEKRYFMYNEMLTRLSQDFLPIKLGFNKAEKEVKSLLKALSIDTIARESRNLSKLISSNPLATLVPVVKQIENYDKVSELVIFTARFFNEFSFDVLQYVLLLRLTFQRSAIQSNGVNQAPWVQRLAVFIASLAKHCTEMDLSNIITYIIKTLHNPDDETNIIAVAILKELIITVGGIRDHNEVPFKILLMLNSGTPLKQEARKLIYDSRDSNIDVAKNLISLFIKQNSISELILLIYNLNMQVNQTESHYKILSTRCDEMTNLLWSFIELVKFCCKNDSFVANVLPFQELTNKFHLATPWVFHIWRDYIDQKENAQEDTDETSTKNDENISDINFDVVMEEAVFPDIDFTHLSRDLFLTFWKLSLYDIFLEKSLYDELKNKLESLERKETNSRKKALINNKIKKILVSFISHQRTFKQTSSLLKEKVKSWLEIFDTQKIQSLLQYAIIPRVLFSPSDAIYSAIFILQVFEIKETIMIFNALIQSNILETLLFSCTSAEAGNLGMFFFTMLDSIEKERKNNSADTVSYKRQIYELQTSIVRQIINCLSSKNYMSIRNGIEFMKHLSLIFPVVDNHLTILIILLEENLLSEKREDIMLPTNALLGHLRARLKNSAVKLEDFCEMSENEIKEKGEYESELNEITQYEISLANEQKEIEIRKKLEMNKLQRKKEQEKEEKQEKEKMSLDEKLSRLPKAPSSTKLSQQLTTTNKLSLQQTETGTKKLEWKMYKVERCMEDVIEALKINDIEGASLFIPDEKVQNELKILLKNQNKPLKEFRENVHKILKDWFTSLVHYPNNPDFVKQLNALKNSITYISNQDLSSMEDMYGESTQVPKKPSRYNNTTTTTTETEKIVPLPPQPASSLSSAPKVADTTKTPLEQSRYAGDKTSNKVDKVPIRNPPTKPAEKKYRNANDDPRGFDNIASGNSKTGSSVDLRNVERRIPPKGPNKSRFDNYSRNDRHVPGKEDKFVKKDDRFNFKRPVPSRDFNELPSSKRLNIMGPQRDYHSFAPTQPSSRRKMSNNSSNTNNTNNNGKRYDDAHNKPPYNRNDNKATFPQGPKNAGSRYQR